LSVAKCESNATYCYYYGPYSFLQKNNLRSVSEFSFKKKLSRPSSSTKRNTVYFTRLPNTISLFFIFGCFLHYVDGKSHSVSTVNPANSYYCLQSHFQLFQRNAEVLSPRLQNELREHANVREKLKVNLSLQQHEGKMRAGSIILAFLISALD
jgi:hypothetical protein